MIFLCLTQCWTIHWLSFVLFDSVFLLNVLINKHKMPGKQPWLWKKNKNESKDIVNVPGNSFAVASNKWRVHYAHYAIRKQYFDVQGTCCAWKSTKKKLTWKKRREHRRLEEIDFDVGTLFRHDMQMKHNIAYQCGYCFVCELSILYTKFPV